MERQGARVVSADGAGEGDSPEAALMRRLIDAIASYAESGIMRSGWAKSVSNLQLGYL